MPTSSETYGIIVFVSASALMIYSAVRKSMMVPNAAEQAWLDAQLATPITPGQKLTAEEQKWLDKQMQDAQDEEMLDDARQAGTLAHTHARGHASASFLRPILRVCTILYMIVPHFHSCLLRLTIAIPAPPASQPTRPARARARTPAQRRRRRASEKRAHCSTSCCWRGHLSHVCKCRSH